MLGSSRDDQKQHIFLMDLNDFMELWGQLESTLGSFCGLRGVISSKRGLESAIRGSVGSKNEDLEEQNRRRKENGRIKF